MSNGDLNTSSLSLSFSPGEQAEWEPRLVIAIDFGTFASGYALQWRTDFKSDRLKIHANTKWQSTGFCTYKTPTCVLLKPDTSICEFGYKAEARYLSLGEDDDADPEEYFLFKHFKMILYRATGDINGDTEVEGAAGKFQPARIVFARCIQYLMDHAIQHLKTNGLPFPRAETKWVLTVPAIWADAAKSVMREAAMEAGIHGSQLTIALEPECAAIYCSQCPADQLKVAEDEGGLKHMAGPGSVIMVVDMGGGTVDITTMRINTDSTMDHVHTSGGGPWGGMRVDHAFFTLIRDLVGQEVLQKFAEENPMDEYDMRMEFEGNKREVKHPLEQGSKERFRIRLPSSLSFQWRAANGNKTIQQILKENTEMREKVKFTNGRLSFSPDVMQGLFKRNVDEILDYVESSLKEPQVKNLTINSMVVVGGFAMSSYVMYGIRQRMGTYKIPVLRPETTELAVLNGAVLYGQDENIVTSRIMPRTYGVAFTMLFDQEKHRDDEKYEEDGRHWANNVFRKHVTKGQAVNIGEWMSIKEYYPIEDRQTNATLYVFSSPDMEPVHTTDSGCLYVGQFDVKFPPVGASGPRQQRSVQVDMNFSGTEVVVRGRVTGTDKQYKKCLKLR